MWKLKHAISSSGKMHDKSIETVKKVSTLKYDGYLKDNIGNIYYWITYATLTNAIMKCILHNEKYVL